MAGETQVTISASGFTSVVIWCTKLDHNIEKPVIAIDLPANKAAIKGDKSSLDRWETYLIDIGKVKEIITIQGMLIDETTESALEKKNNLFLITGNAVTEDDKATITWGTSSNEQTRNGTINKCMITETPGIIGVQKSGYYSEKNFAVQLAFIIGTIK